MSKRITRLNGNLSHQTLEFSNKLDSYIIVIENAIPDELCKQVISHYKDSDEWSQARVGNEDVRLDTRRVDEIYISLPHIVDKNPIIRKQLDSSMYECASKCIRIYKTLFPYLDISGDSGYNLLRYTKGCFYRQHVDSYTKEPRAVTCSFALNDNFSGGEFGFFNRKHLVKLKRGDALLFPSNFQYPHELLPITKGTRYSIITWFN